MRRVDGPRARPNRAAAGAAPQPRGFALLAVLLVMAVVGVLGAEFAYSMRLEASAVRAYRDTLVAAHLAEAGVEQAVREMLGAGAFVTVADSPPALVGDMAVGGAALPLEAGLTSVLTSLDGWGLISRRGCRLRCGLDGHLEIVGDREQTGLHVVQLPEHRLPALRQVLEHAVFVYFETAQYAGRGA